MQYYCNMQLNNAQSVCAGAVCGENVVVWYGCGAYGPLLRSRLFASQLTVCRRGPRGHSPPGHTCGQMHTTDLIKAARKGALEQGRKRKGVYRGIKEQVTIIHLQETKVEHTGGSHNTVFLYWSVSVIGLDCIHRLMSSNSTSQQGAVCQCWTETWKSTLKKNKV